MHYEIDLFLSLLFAMLVWKVAINFGYGGVLFSAPLWEKIPRLAPCPLPALMPLMRPEDTSTHAEVSTGTQLHATMRTLYKEPNTLELRQAE